MSVTASGQRCRAIRRTPRRHAHRARAALSHGRNSLWPRPRRRPPSATVSPILSSRLRGPSCTRCLALALQSTAWGEDATLALGKWHLGDLWNKHLPDQNKKWPHSSPGDHGFDEWMMTQAEASSSMSNCGCFPVNHTHPGPRPPSGYSKITPHGNHCVVGGG